MVQVKRTFAAGKMNKSVDERLLPPGEYVDAQNLRLGSTEDTEIGSIEITRGNTQLTNISFNNTALSNNARCIGSLADYESETIYWFINDPTFTGQGVGSPLLTTILDLVVSYNSNTGQVAYHLVSVQEGTSARSTLNFNPRHLITGVNLVDDLLFWTDDLNPPRCINVLRGYAPPTISANVIVTSDNFSAEEIRVIVRPPTNAPIVSTSSGDEEFNFLEEKFISFAYRYRYEDGQYSATSQFSAPAFIPKSFQFSPESFLNEGMVNQNNIATVTFNTGSSLVKGIELLWKDNDNGIIKVMERITKEGLYADNINISRQFNTSKILTVLPDSEILRLYDNVPRFAKAQTLMGNRLVYGNYVENYDLKVADTPDAATTNIDYECSVVHTEIGEIDLTASASTTNNTYNLPINPFTPNNAAIEIDLSSVSASLVAGSVLSISIETQLSYQWQSQGGTPATNPIPSNANPSAQFNVEFDYTLPQDFSGVADLVASPNFQAALGVGTAQAMPACALGNSLTDIWNTAAPIGFNTTLSPYNAPVIPFVDTMGLYKTEYGIDVPGQAVVGTSVGNTMRLVFPVIRYSQLPADTTNDAIAYYVMFRIGTVEVNYQTPSAPPSLHSNRGYEVGIVYMDAFKRATTAFTSLNNAVHVGCSYSDVQNRIKVNIPITQVAPWWAQTYKFCIKPSATTYETIYANLVFREPGSADAYILLEGENARKVEDGTRLIVKADMGGPLNQCRYITVLEKKAQATGFITVLTDPSDPDSGTPAPAGVYMKVKASGFDLDVPADAITTTGWKSKTKGGSGNYPKIKLGPAAFNVDNGDGTFGAPLPLPAGSRVRMKFYFYRKGPGAGNGACERREYDWQPSDFFVGADYNSVIDWFEAENIADIIESNNGSQNVGGGDCDIDNNVYLSGTTTPFTDNEDFLDYSGNAYVCVNGWVWFQDPTTQNIKFMVRGTKACGSSNAKKSKVEGEITIFRASNLLIFETEPTDGLPDVWFEGADNFGIQNGNHLSGNSAFDVNQDIANGIPGEVLLSNFNCYAFGNGAESYTIRDSVKGDSFNLGNRVTSTASQDYGRAHRYADLTYSGVYNDFSNINKLNEFNLGLLNFKPLEDSFGPVQKLVGRKSDILVLQEDKISYVLAGKNLLSDSTGGGAVTATPTVLGTQIARLEEYGISKNPESYAEYGYDKYFADQKRGAIIKLQGGSHSTEQLEVISEYGMRSFFRDLFIAEPNDIKLGGYDPYMNEYVINSSDILLPSDIPCINCDATYTYQFNTTQINLCAEFGNAVGTVTIETVEIIDIIVVNYNGISYAAAGTNTITFPKTAQSPTKADISFLSATLLTVTFVAFCVVPIPLKIRRLVINSPQYGIPESQRIHNQIQYVEGSYISPTYPDNSDTPDYLLDDAQSLTGPGFPFTVSVCETEEGFQGEGYFPTDGATLSVKSTKVFATDDFNFDPTYHRLGFFRVSDSLFLACNFANLTTVINSATYPALNAPQTTSIAEINSVTGAMPAPSGLAGTDELWLVYDYRVVKEVNLCHIPSAVEDPSVVEELCCDCACPTGQNTTFTLFTSTNQFGSTALITFTYYDINGVLQTSSLQPGVFTTVCVSGTASPPNPVVLPGYNEVVDITIDECNCNTDEIIYN